MSDQLCNTYVRRFVRKLLVVWPDFFKHTLPRKYFFWTETCPCKRRTEPRPNTFIVAYNGPFFLWKWLAKKWGIVNNAREDCEISLKIWCCCAAASRCSRMFVIVFTTAFNALIYRLSPPFLSYLFIHHVLNTNILIYLVVANWSNRYRFASCTPSVPSVPKWIEQIMSILVATALVMRKALLQKNSENGCGRQPPSGCLL